MVLKRLGVVAIVILSLLLIHPITAVSESKQKKPAPTTTTVKRKATLTRAQYRELGQYLTALERQRVGDYILSVMMAELVAYIQAEEAAAAAAWAAQQAEARSVVRVQNNGAHSDAWWQAVAVCEQSGNNDPFFGYFSIMDGSAGGLPWDTQVAMANGIIARAGDGAWAQSCVEAGYRASPSG